MVLIDQLLEAHPLHLLVLVYGVHDDLGVDVFEGFLLWVVLAVGHALGFEAVGDDPVDEVVGFVRQLVFEFDAVWVGLEG